MLKLKDRMVSSFNISIGTGIALEALFNPTNEKYNPENNVDKFNKEYKHLFISIYTLVRNIVQSIDTQTRKKIFMDLYSKDLYNTLLQEIETIRALGNTLDKEVTFFPYVLPKLFPVNGNSNGKVTNNDYIIMLYRNIIPKLDLKVINNNTYKYIDRPITKMNVKDSVMFTSLGVDLIDYRGYWLESHTGKVNNTLHFNKKYHTLKGMDKSILPFNDILFKIFGDNSGLIEVPKPRFRREVYDWLVKNKVNPKRDRSWCKRAINQL